MKHTMIGALALALVVGAGCNIDESTGTRAKALDDATITAKIEAVYLADPNLSAWKIDAHTERGIVTITGHVDSSDDKDLAGRLARQTEGVREVRNYLDIEPATAARSVTDTLEDVALTATVKTSLAVEKGVGASHIDVDTQDGVVTLNGDVASMREADLAIQCAQNVDGVKYVINNLRVVTG